MKKLLLLITVIVAMLLAGCAPKTVYIEKDDDDSKSSSSSKNYSDEYDNQSDNPNNNYNNDNNDRESEKNNSPEVGEQIEGAGTGDAEDERTETTPLADGEYALDSPRTLTIPQIGSFKITSFIISERRGEKIITFNGDYTNLNPNYDMSLSSFRSYFEVYQDDIRLTHAYHDNDVDLYTNIKKDKTIKAGCSFTLRTETDDIEIIGKDYNDVEYVVTFPIR